ncbi:MAG: L-histidine N(alpha)-methyltransferase [Sphingobium sp.]
MLRDVDRSQSPTGFDPNFHADVIAGLSAPQKVVPARWLYDRRGSELFEDITQLPEYYLTRTEAALLQDHAPAVARLVSRGRAVVEFGSGSSTKTPLLLAGIDAACYVPIDISGDFLLHSAKALAARFPALPVYPVEADFTRPVPLPGQIGKAPRLGFFPGSTIGNLTAADAVDLLRTIAATLGHGALLLIGMDRVKDRQELMAAYDDAQGITAAFNLNLLTRINRELGADIPIDLFAHRTIWNDAEARIEMHLEAREETRFSIGSRSFTMRAGETIHTENSHKYSARSARLLLSAGGWTPVMEWTDPADRFALLLVEARSPAPRP